MDDREEHEYADKGDDQPDADIRFATGPPCLQQGRAESGHSLRKRDLTSVAANIDLHRDHGLTQQLGSQPRNTFVGSMLPVPVSA